MPLDTQDQKGTKLGDVLDVIIRKASLSDLTDFYSGAVIDYEGGQLAVYFSEGATEEQLAQLVDNLDEEEGYEVKIEKAQVADAAWVLKVLQTVTVNTTPEFSGQVPVTAPLAGQVSMTGQGQGTEEPG